MAPKRPRRRDCNLACAVVNIISFETHLIRCDDDERRLWVYGVHARIDAVELPESDACHGYERVRPCGEQLARGPEDNPSQVAAYQAFASAEGRAVNTKTCQ